MSVLGIKCETKLQGSGVRWGQGGGVTFHQKPRAKEDDSVPQQNTCPSCLWRLFPLQDKLNPTLTSVAPYLHWMQLVNDQPVFYPQAALSRPVSVEENQPLQDLSF